MDSTEIKNPKWALYPICLGFTVHACHKMAACFSDIKLQQRPGVYSKLVVLVVL